MDDAQARAILRELRAKNGSLFMSIFWISLGGKEVILDTELLPEEIEALAWAILHKQRNQNPTS